MHSHQIRRKKWCISTFKRTESEGLDDSRKEGRDGSEGTVESEIDDSTAVDLLIEVSTAVTLDVQSDMSAHPPVLKRSGDMCLKVKYEILIHMSLLRKINLITFIHHKPRISANTSIHSGQRDPPLVLIKELCHLRSVR